MKNLSILILLTIATGILILIGTMITNEPQKDVRKVKSETTHTVPHLGSIELLNGCGADGAARQVANYLRSKSFDVKNIECVKTVEKRDFTATLAYGNSVYRGCADGMQ